MPAELVPGEQARLAELERVIDRGLQTFYEVGRALLEIREAKLYRETHGTFQAYCRERFGFSDSRGRQLIAAAKTVTAGNALGLPAPRTEREARELARRLRAEADALDGGDEERRRLIANAQELIRKGDECMRLAIREANLAIGADPDDPDVVREAEAIVATAHAWLEEDDDAR